MAQKEEGGPEGWGAALPLLPSSVLLLCSPLRGFIPETNAVCPPLHLLFISIIFFFSFFAVLGEKEDFLAQLGPENTSLNRHFCLFMKSLGLIYVI